MPRSRSRSDSRERRHKRQSSRREFLRDDDRRQRDRRRQHDRRRRRSNTPSDHQDRRHSSRRHPIDTRNKSNDISQRSQSRSQHRSRSRSPSREAKSEKSEKSEDVCKANLALSGKLAAESNKVNGVVLKFTEPAEAQIPETRWRLYVFKNGEVMGDPILLHRRSCFLFGRDRTVCDIPADHPSCSKQHCILQFRCVEVDNVVTGMTKEVVKPYLMDLDSINGTFINKQRMESRRYYELLEQDTIRLGMSTREYVFLHEGSTT